MLLLALQPTYPMKLASYNDGSRDGQLIVVSRDLSSAHYANGIATRLQQVLDDWNFLSPQLDELYTQLNHGKLRHAFAFDPKLCMAPLPRAYQCIEALSPDEEAAEPLMQQVGSDDFIGACETLRFGAEAMGLGCEPRLAAVCGDVAQGAGPEQALEGVRLLALAGSWLLRQLEPAERARGAGLLQSRPATAFAPVALTPDELGEAWQGGRARLTLQAMVNGRKSGGAGSETGARWHLGQLIAHATRTRRLRAGSIVGSGPLDLQALPALKFGDSLRLELKSPDGLSPFGAIDQDVEALA